MKKIEVSKLSKSIKGKKLENINISFEEGCVYKLLGGNGCGKTTLIRCILGITDYDFGRIKRYSGIDEYEIGTEEVFKYISVFLSDTSLPKTLKVCECLELFRVVNEFKGKIGEII